MSWFDDFNKHELPDVGDNHNDEQQGISSVLKWISSVLGSLIVLLVWDLYSSNQAMLEKVSDSMHALANKQAEISIKIQNIERQLEELKDRQQ